MPDLDSGPDEIAAYIEEVLGLGIAGQHPFIEVAGQGYTVFAEHRYGGFDKFDLAGRKHCFTFGAEGGTVEGATRSLGRRWLSRLLVNLVIAIVIIYVKQIFLVYG